MIKPVRWTTHHKLIPAESIQAIHEASLRILEHTGLVMPLSLARGQHTNHVVGGVTTFMIIKHHIS